MKIYDIKAISDGHTVHEWTVSANNALAAIEKLIPPELPKGRPLKIHVERPMTGVTVIFNVVLA